MKAVIGVRGFNNDLSTDGFINTLITLNVNKYSLFSQLTYVNLDSFAGYDQADPSVAASSAPYASITAAEINATEFTVIKSIDFTAINPATGGPGSGNLVNEYSINYNYPLSLSLDLVLLKKTGTKATVLISPISIKYRW